MSKQYCVIIDAFSTCRYLAAEFTQRGYLCIHVQSPGEKAAYYSGSYIPEDFALEIAEKDDIDKIIAQLIDLPIVCVVAGSDPAGPVADAIAQALGLTQNEVASSLVRRNKHAMANRLAQFGLAHIVDLVSNNPKEIIAWADEHQAWPIIIKPEDGAASEGLSICQHADDVGPAMDYLLNHTSFLGHSFQQALVQPFLNGQEYIVNTVACDGRHYVCDIWQSNKFHVHGSIIYDTMVLMPAQGDVQDALVPYTLKVVEALGFKLGPTHSELMLTDKGPILIETNGRIMGLGIPNVLQQQALARSQITLTAEAFVDPHSFAQHTQSAYVLKKNMVCVLHRVTHDECVVNETAISFIKQLPSFSFHKFAGSGAVPKTIDLLTSPGWILLMHEDMTVIEQDIQRIREIEETSLFIRP